MSLATPPRTDSKTPPGRTSEPPNQAAGAAAALQGVPESPPSSNALRRTFPARDLFRGQACLSLVYSAAAAMVLAALLLIGLVTAFLLQCQGQVTLQRGEVAEFRDLTGVEVAPGDRQNLGLAALAWTVRHSRWSAPIAALSREATWLNENVSAFLVLLCLLVVLAIAHRLLLWLARFAATKSGLQAATQLRRSLHRQALRIAPADLQESDKLRVTKLFSEDVSAVQAAVSHRVFVLGAAVGSAVVLTVFAVLIDWRVALQVLIPLGCCWYLYLRLRSRQAQRMAAEKQSLDDEFEGLSEGFAKTRIIRGYGMENPEHRQFRGDLEAFHRKVAGTNRWCDGLRWLTFLLACAAAVIVVFFVGIKVLQPLNGAAGLSPAAGLILVGLVGLMYRPVDQLSALPVQWRHAGQAAERIYAYIDRIPEVSQAVGAKFLQPLSSSLQFEAVHYDAPEHGPVLNGIDLKLEAYKVHAFVALDPLQSHALAYLLPRFIEPKSGRVLIDGEDIAWVTLESLRAETAYVGCEDPWFTGTVLENIRCSDERRSLQDVTDAAKTVHAHKFISRLPKGYETRLGREGLRLNPGEAFRLALARAVLIDPALMIIEEPPVTLDADTKSLLDDAYNRIIPGRTIIFLPSRLSTVRRADFVVLLHNGKVEAVGKHGTLVKSSAVYRHWEYSRFNEFRNGNES